MMATPREKSGVAIEPLQKWLVGNQLLKKSIMITKLFFL